MKEQKWIIAIVVALVAMGGIFLSLSKKAEPTIKAEAKLTPFGQYLKDEGVVLYGAEWCPHCQNQKKTLGDGTWEAVYKECVVPGRRQLDKACEDAKIESFPTWVFKDGTQKVGEISLDEIMNLSGYDKVSTNTRAN
jgi:glutaredoxin